MLSKEELKSRKLSFWNDLKIELSNHRSSSGKRINWLSYPTEIKHVYLRLEVEKKHVALNFDLQFKDDSIRAVFWEQMGELKTVLTQEMGEIGFWEENCSSESVQQFSRIQWKKENLNYLNENDKMNIFAFFKEKLIAFDSFYQEFKDILLFLAK
jgi:hypothetical protein